jgi:hypothetical protein
MANFVQIFAEGDGDVKFISDYIAHIVPGATVKILKGKVAHISMDDVPEIKVQGLNGWTDIQHVHNQFIQNTANNGVNLIIFDADSIENEGGFTKRKQDIGDKMKGLSHEIFLFPNNQGDGALECLLENIINKKNTPIFECWGKFEICLQEHASKEIYQEDENKKLTTPAKKSKIYVYLEALLGKTKEEKKRIKDPNREYQNSEYWNLDADYLNPLKEFLLKYLP